MAAACLRAPRQAVPGRASRRRIPGRHAGRRGIPLLVLCLALGAGAAGAEPEGWAYTLANELMSPFCPGRTLAECPSPQAEDLRLWIIVQEAAGRSQGEVEEELYARFGDIIRSTPEPKGIGISAYALPLAVFVGGGFVVAFVLRRITAKPAAVADGAVGAAVPPLDAEFERLIDEARLG